MVSLDDLRHEKRAAILELARRHGLVVIEDAGRTLGGEYDGHRAGSMGVMGSFYFSPTEAFGNVGDSGMVVTGISRRRRPSGRIQR